MEYEINNDQYITSSTIKNTNSIDAVEGSYYKKELDKDIKTTVEIPELQDTNASWELIGEYEETNEVTGFTTTLTIHKVGDLYRFRRVDTDGYRHPLFQGCDGRWADSFTEFRYDTDEYRLYEMEARLVTIESREELNLDSYTISQYAIGKKYKEYQSSSGYKITTSEPKKVSPMTDEMYLNTWRYQETIQTSKQLTPKEFYDSVNNHIHKSIDGTVLKYGEFNLLNTSIVPLSSSGSVYKYCFWAVCSLLGLYNLRTNAVYQIASTTTSIASSSFGEANVISPNGKFFAYNKYYDVSPETNTLVVFNEDSSSVDITKDGYSEKSAKFALSHETNPKTKYTVADTKLLTKASYVKRYNEDGSLSTYKQPLYAEIADTILSNSNKNKKTTTIDYIGTDNIQTGDTIFFAKDPSTKYIVTKTYLKANPFFVKTLYAREI